MMETARHSVRQGGGDAGRRSGLALALLCLLAFVLHGALHDHDHDDLAKAPHCTVCSIASHAMPVAGTGSVALPSYETDWAVAELLFAGVIPGDLPELPPGQRAPPQALSL